MQRLPLSTTPLAILTALTLLPALPATAITTVTYKTLSGNDLETYYHLNGVLQAMGRYTSAHDGAPKDAANYEDILKAEELKASDPVAPSDFNCPVDPHARFSMNPGAAGMSPLEMESLRNTVLLFETVGGKMVFPHHGKSMVVLTDGTVVTIKPGEEKKLIWNPGPFVPTDEQTCRYCLYGFFADVENYVGDYGHLPATKDFRQQIQLYGKLDRWTCPADERVQYLPNRRITSPDDTSMANPKLVVVFEGIDGHMAFPHHGLGFAILVDGTVVDVTPAQSKRLQWKPN